eukprot:CAMPEP_0182425352 /NCGR_PEP_ID=MMETSP1167-20130531/11754_1 /TAXON_ID=2988 /ORGANISM="Mallomonas Sp, Strain CCMP3275" /LENGTH=230 /DNA_ID=CAMNT_0024605985 /DNA_START=291 /DNA_END=980 /DNA_ORIENTATION=+
MSYLYVSYGHPGSLSASGCDSTRSIISITTILMGAALGLQLFGSSNGSILTSGIISVYAAILTYSSVSLSPNPHCYPSSSSSFSSFSSSHGSIVSISLGIAMAFLSIAWNAVVSSRRILGILSDGSDLSQHALVAASIGSTANNSGRRTVDFKGNLRFSLFCANLTFLMLLCYFSMVLTNWGVPGHISLSLDETGSSVIINTFSMDTSHVQSYNAHAGYVSMWLQASGAW